MNKETQKKNKANSLKDAIILFPKPCQNLTILLLSLFFFFISWEVWACTWRVLCFLEQQILIIESLSDKDWKFGSIFYNIKMDTCVFHFIEIYVSISWNKTDTYLKYQNLSIYIPRPYSLWDAYGLISTFLLFISCLIQ